MIVEREVFRDGRLPRELKHRESEVEVLSKALDPTRTGQPADDVLLAGPSGVGKTTIAKHTLSRVERHAHVPEAHIRCVGETTGEILRTALREYPGERDVPGNMPVDDVRDVLRETIDSPYVLILDEGDDLPEEVLDIIASIPRVSIIAICHHPQRWLATAPDDIRESIEGPVNVEKFSTGELADILRDRATYGLRPNVVSDPQLRTIADEVAGVARKGIQALRAAAEIAAERGHSKIRDEDIADSYERAQQRIRQANLRSLMFHHHVLYGLLHGAGELSGEELHRRYDEVEDVYEGHEKTPIVRRTRRKKLRKLKEYELVGWREDDSGRTYWVVDEGVAPVGVGRGVGITTPL